jgi:hypothetical protein
LEAVMVVLSVRRHGFGVAVGNTTVAWFLKPHTSISIPSRHGVVCFKFSVLAIFRARLGCGKTPLRTRPQPDLELVEHGELMSERQIIQRELEMGLEAGEEGSQKRQNDIKHDEACFGRRYSKTNVLEGLWSFRHAQAGPAA